MKIVKLIAIIAVFAIPMYIGNSIHPANFYISNVGGWNWGIGLRQRCYEYDNYSVPGYYTPYYRQCSHLFRFQMSFLFSPDHKHFERSRFCILPSMETNGKYQFWFYCSRLDSVLRY